MLLSSPSYREDFISNIIIWQVSVSAATHESRVGFLSEQNNEGVQCLQSAAHQLWASLFSKQAVKVVETPHTCVFTEAVMPVNVSHIVRWRAGL